jgi:hypothetical protein
MSIFWPDRTNVSVEGLVDMFDQVFEAFEHTSNELRLLDLEGGVIRSSQVQRMGFQIEEMEYLQDELYALGELQTVAMDSFGLPVLRTVAGEGVVGGAETALGAGVTAVEAEELGALAAAAPVVATALAAAALIGYVVYELVSSYQQYERQPDIVKPLPLTIGKYLNTVPKFGKERLVLPASFPYRKCCFE